MGEPAPVKDEPVVAAEKEAPQLTDAEKEARSAELEDMVTLDAKNVPEQEAPVKDEPAPAPVKDEPASVKVEPTPAKSDTAVAGSSHPSPEEVGEMSLEELQDPAAWKAKNVDPAHRERYLGCHEFKNFFGVDKFAFSDLPKWKQDKLKKDHKLF